MQKAPQFALNRGVSYCYLLCCYLLFCFSITILFFNDNLPCIGNPFYISTQCFCHIAASLLLFHLPASACDRWSPCREIHQFSYPCTSFINSLSLILAFCAAIAGANNFSFTKAINVSCIPCTLPSALSSRPRFSA